MIIVFFFKQKTAYEVKECDWSSDVCPSDLPTPGSGPPFFPEKRAPPGKSVTPRKKCHPPEKVPPPEKVSPPQKRGRNPKKNEKTGSKSEYTSLKHHMLGKTAFLATFPGIPGSHSPNSGRFAFFTDKLSRAVKTEVKTC